MIKRAVNVMVSLAVIFTAFFPFSVYAEEDEPSHVDDNYFINPYSYAAYYLFKTMKFEPAATTLSEIQNIAYDLVHSGELTLTGEGTGTFNVVLDSVTDNNNNYITINESTNISEVLGSGTIDGTNTSYITVPKLTFKTKTTNSTYSTVSNVINCNIVGATQNYSCTFSPYELTEMDSVNLNTNNLTFTISQQNITGTDTTTGRDVIKLDISTTGSVEGTIEFNLSGDFDLSTTGNVYNEIEHEWIYNYPLVNQSVGGASALFRSGTEYSTYYNGYPIILSYYTEKGIQANNWSIATTSSTSNIRLYKVIKDFANNYWFYKFTIIWVCSSPEQTIRISLSNTSPSFNGMFIPLYFGNGKDLSEEWANYIGINSVTQELLEHGDENSMYTGADASMENFDFEQQNINFQNLENTFNNNFNSAINNLNISDTLTSNEKFASSANWVRVQFNRMVNNTPLSSVITFCLIIGFALIMIGKVSR